MCVFNYYLASLDCFSGVCGQVCTVHTLLDQHLSHSPVAPGTFLPVAMLSLVNSCSSQHSNVNKSLCSDDFTCEKVNSATQLSSLLFILL